MPLDKPVFFWDKLVFFFKQLILVRLWGNGVKNGKNGCFLLFIPLFRLLPFP
jgi:hypothetical protein